MNERLAFELRGNLVHFVEVPFPDGRIKNPGPEDYAGTYRVGTAMVQIGGTWIPAGIPTSPFSG